ncbi:hypothetical protein [Aquimarina algiphila]|uniref:Uncharacterized protein n=1 Tax=Aquimarina algiphila TaxID=2047982 RepID=A0A554VP22_9FLAO|nr:hypothetical protein [Aquimarina algiphila]TSE10129.1 hypothetical protein FOF46_06285 [Aquimarina algiphila]
MKNRYDLISFFYFMSFFCINAQGIEEGTYYNTNENYKKVEITQCCDNGTLNLDFYHINGEINKRELIAVKGTKDLYIYVGNGFSYVVLLRDGKLERYGFDEANRPEFMLSTAFLTCTNVELLSKDKSVVASESSRLRQMNEELTKSILEKKVRRIFLADVISLNVIPGSVDIPFGNLYKPKESFIGGKLKITISKFNPMDSSWGQEKSSVGFRPSRTYNKNESYSEYYPYNESNNSSIIVTSKYDTYKLCRSNFDPNLFFLPGQPGEELNHFIKFKEDGNHIFGELAIAVDQSATPTVNLYNKDKKLKVDLSVLNSYKEKGKLIKKNIKKEVFDYIDFLIDGSKELPKPKMKNPKLEQEIVLLANKSAKEKGWDQKFYKAVIMHDEWTIIRHDISGVIMRKMIKAAVVSKDSKGKCSYKYADIYKEYINGSYQTKSKLWEIINGANLDCSKIK